MKHLTTLFIFLAFMMDGFAAPPGIIENCLAKQVSGLKNNCLQLYITETSSRFYHSFEPWQKSTRNSRGHIYITGELFLKADTLNQNNKQYTSKVKYSPDGLLVQDYGDTGLSAVTKKKFDEYLFETCRYSPVHIVSYFYAHQGEAKPDAAATHYTSSLVINKTTVTLYINKADSLVSKITLLAYDGLYGDIITTYTYSQYEKLGTVYFPKKISIEKINGKIADEVTVASAEFIKEIPELLEKPADFAWKEETVEKPEEISVEKYNNHIYFLTLKNADAKSMVVEFKDFVLVAEAPLTIANGKMILDEVKKLAPNKPVKYFAYGHFHNWYLGGVRPFVHAGCTVLCPPQSQAYVEYIAGAQHTQNPDDLQKQPKKLLIQVISDSLAITDGEFTMKMYVIGKTSEHTSDYVIYYFPAEKLLFQDDLVWVEKEGEIKKAGKRQEGLYKAITGLGLSVETIVQSWPVAGYGVKSVIPYADLEQSVKK